MNGVHTLEPLKASGASFMKIEREKAVPTAAVLSLKKPRSRLHYLIHECLTTYRNKAESA